MTVSSAGFVVGARDGARASKEGSAALESVDDTDRGESGAMAIVPTADLFVGEDRVTTLQGADTLR